jgi:hypothetical protein
MTAKSQGFLPMAGRDGPHGRIHGRLTAGKSLKKMKIIG